MNKLDAALPPIWSRANPVDIAGDTDAGRYATAFQGLLEDPDNDAVMVMNVPTALASLQCRERLGGLLRYYHQEAAYAGEAPQMNFLTIRDI
jgi:acyl-CoA synthetase (NDP forming)